MNETTPSRANGVVLKQMLHVIPFGMINRRARETGIDSKARSFSVLSHLSAMLFGQLSHAMGLNDLCDWLRLKSTVSGSTGRYSYRAGPSITVTPINPTDFQNVSSILSAHFRSKGIR